MNISKVIYLCIFVAVVAASQVMAEMEATATAEIGDVVMANGDGGMYTTQAVDAAAWNTYSQEFLTLINNYRASRGIAPLTPDTLLQSASQWMSADMLSHCVSTTCSHTDSLGRNVPSRLAAFGYPATSVGYGEIIAWGTYGGVVDAQEAFDLWKNSPGHNYLMLQNGYKAIGIGRSCNSNLDCAWVVNFGGKVIQPIDTNPTPTPTPSPTPTPTPAPAGKVKGYAYNDQNANKIQDASEAGMQGLKIKLSGGGVTRYSTTDSSGYYEFTGLKSGSYTLSAPYVFGYMSTTSTFYSLYISTNTVQKNFGYKHI